ncbi:class D sortase [Paenibacillus aceris]|uniref:Sortase A n=1 Tax=Paenibacillus aceris TaxID=869555 RepID=A0ABS4I8G6_9BACL|nr:class D sortase [Paenibacillus aceris]MBP1967231.1 sortase A [Paenibacillus aceris]NHW36269.1 class D sortase [Paenibacillus aceris]
MIRKTISISCIILGIMIFLYPSINDRYESYLQQKILKQWQENMQAMDQLATEETETVSAGGPVDTVNAIGASDTADIASTVNTADTSSSSGSIPSAVPAAALQTSQPSKAQQATPKTTPILPKNIEGVLLIKKINLKLPILTDATVENLKVSIASMAHTGKPGELGNYAIAGHRNLTYGKNFNRLDEVELGDVIQVDTGSKLFDYIVDGKEYVLPTDVSVLKGNGKDREITLITCDPMVNPTHRLIVKAKMVESTG